MNETDLGQGYCVRLLSDYTCKFGLRPQIVSDGKEDNSKYTTSYKTNFSQRGERPEKYTIFVTVIPLDKLSARLTFDTYLCLQQILVHIQAVACLDSTHKPHVVAVRIEVEWSHKVCCAFRPSLHSVLFQLFLLQSLLVLPHTRTCIWYLPILSSSSLEKVGTL